jgi:hypothetical protein
MTAAKVRGQMNMSLTQDAGMLHYGLELSGPHGGKYDEDVSLLGCCEV